MTASHSGRADYDAVFRNPLLAPGEPQFVLRGRDILAEQAVEFWAARALAQGVDAAVVEQALAQADRLRAWPGRRFPDADHLTEAERLQLRYQFSRRAWRALVDNVPADPLSWQVGWDAAMAWVRAGGAPR